MSKKIDKQIANLEGLRLPELQAKYAEIVGETTRAPNKAFLLRKIREALEAKGRTAKDARSATGERMRGPAQRGKRGPATGLTKMTVEELQAVYLEEVGRPTNSVDKAYLAWKIRMARNGKVPVGPARERKYEPGQTKIVPLTLPRDTVDALDRIVEQTDHKSRSDLIKRAIHDYLRIKGYGSVAQLFEVA
jgi:hypothetical protein